MSEKRSLQFWALEKHFTWILSIPPQKIECFEGLLEALLEVGDLFGAMDQDFWSQPPYRLLVQPPVVLMSTSRTPTLAHRLARVHISGVQDTPCMRKI